MRGPGVDVVGGASGRRALLALALLGALGCSSEGDGDGDGDVGEPPSASVRVLYGPREETELTLYPSNRYTVPDETTATGLRVVVSRETTSDLLVQAYPAVAAQVSALDGFSTSGGVVVRFDGPIDPRGLVELPDADPPVPGPARDARDYQEPGAPLYLVDVDDASPERSRLVGLVPTWWEQAKDDFYTVEELSLVVHPSVPLRPATRYLFAVTRELRARDGTPVGRTREMHRLLEAAPSDAYSEEVHRGLTVLEDAAGVRRDELSAVTTFTTADVPAVLARHAAARRAAPAPAQGDPFTVETPDRGDGRVRFRATFAAPELRSPKPEGKWRLDEAGLPRVVSEASLELFLAFSDATRGGRRPVVIYGHGLGGDKDGCWGTAERLRQIHENGAAVFAIDSPEHGSRLQGETTLISSVYGFFGIDQATNDFDIERARDNFRQMASDQLELVRFIATLGELDLLPLGPDGQPQGDGEPDLDVSRTLYVGHSFGSVQGPTIAALAPEVKHVVWNVGGANLMMLLRDSGTFSFVVRGLAPEGTPFGAVARFMAVAQAIVDPGDPINYARYVTLEALEGVEGWSSRDVLLQEVIADGIVPNSTTEALARAAGLELVGKVRTVSGVVERAGPVTGNLPAGGTGVLSQWDRVTGDSGAARRADHGGLIFTPEARAQYVEFFRSALAAGRATAIEPPRP